MLRSLLLAVASLQIACFATVSFNIDAERLDDASGSPMPNNGLVIFVVDRNDDGFLDPDTTWFTQADDLLLAAWPNPSEGTPFALGPGVFQGAAPGISLGNGVDTGDPVKLFWFPTLTSTNSAPTFGTAFGAYTTAAWLVPSEGNSVNLTFFNADAVGGGPEPAASGDATFTVVPEPATYAAAFALGCLGWAMAKRRNKQG